MSRIGPGTDGTGWSPTRGGEKEAQGKGWEFATCNQRSLNIGELLIIHGMIVRTIVQSFMCIENKVVCVKLGLC